ncbi:hypothetical protein F5146DRAFT_935753, partial [Armillaria mellea]
HILDKLLICKGLPMIIWLNSAMELSIMKWQKCTVHSWIETIGSQGLKVLNTLFVKLIYPPQDMNILGLPMNMVPLICTLQTILCYLADNSIIKINRSQVEIIPNFTMTNYCLQGKMRLINLVDLTNCQLHYCIITIISYYTALSQSASAAGTILLPDFTDLKKIQRGCSGYLRQEFRELEILDHITQLQYEGTIPVLVLGKW